MTSLLDTARKLLGVKNMPARSVIEKALRESEAERERAANAVAELQAKRRDVLLSADDSVAAEHDAVIAREERARDRAEALIEELEQRLTVVAEKERAEAIAKARQTAEDHVAAAIAALQEYPTLAAELRALVGVVETGEKAAAEFNCKHPDEPKIHGPESRLRWLKPTPRREVKRETIRLWTYDETGVIVAEERLDQIFKHGATIGSITSPQSMHRSPVSLRDFVRVSFTPAFRGTVPTPLAHSVVLPSLTPDTAAILDTERRLPGPVSPIPEVETELVPLTNAADAA